jgi:autotransporter-associated beta strand protein
MLRDATSGGTLAKTGLGVLTLTAPNTYSGNTYVGAGTLSLKYPFLSDAAGVHIASGALLELTFAGSDTVRSLELDGVPAAFGTWGNSASGAAHIDNVHFLGSGMLNVVPEPSAFVLLAIGLCGVRSTVGGAVHGRKRG